MVRGDGRYEKLEHQSGFLHERGLVSPEMQEYNRQLWFFERLAGGDRKKLDPGLVDRVHLDLAEAAVKQLKATGLYEEWLDAWDVHNGIEIAQPKDKPTPTPPHLTERTPAAAEITPAQRLLDIAEELQRNLRLIRGERSVVVEAPADETLWD